MDPEDNARFQARLRESVERVGSVNGLAKGAGVSEGALRKWLQGDSEPTRERLMALARAAGVNVAWLAAGTGPRDRAGQADVAPLEGYLALDPVAGEPEGGSRTRLAFGMAWVDAHGGAAQLGLTTMPDDSMAPLLRAGATLVLQRATEGIYRDGIYALILDGALLVRRLQRLPGGQLQASAENPAYHPFHFPPGDPSVTVLGRVTWFGQDL
jgi:transcriptional regulator with XRE-family HTH domain